MAIVLLLFLSLLSIRCTAEVGLAGPPRTDPSSSSGDPRLQSKADAAGGRVVPAVLWCVAKNNAEDGALQAALDWACGPGGADCRPIQEGGACFEPNDVQFHASYAFNDYYLRNGLSPQACDFSGTAALTSLDPGNKICHLPSSSSARNGSFTGTATGTSGGMGLGPAGADTSGGHVGVRWAGPVGLAALLVLVTATIGGSCCSL